MTNQADSAWHRFCDLNLSTTQGRKTARAMLRAGEFTAIQAASVRRWLDGPTKAEAKESAARKRYLATWKPTKAEIDRTCRFDGLPKLGR